MFGVGSTVNGTPLLAMPPSVTTTLPVVAPLGTLTVIEPAAQLATLVTAVPLNLTVLRLWSSRLHQWCKGLAEY
jgi:hypothetical protein